MSTATQRPAAATAPPIGARARILAAFLALVAERGYPETTIEAIVERASISPNTLYAHFTDKREVLLAAIDDATHLAAGAATFGVRFDPDWARALRAGFEALLHALAAEPELAHLLLVGVDVAGPAAVERRARGLRPGAETIRTAAAPDRISDLQAEVTSAALLTLCARQARESGARSLPAVAPLCTYLAAAPFIGADRACAAANAPVGSREEERGWSPNMRRFYEDDWGRLGLGERERISREVLELMREEIETAVAARTFDHRPERHLTRNGLRLDERGWRDLLKAHDELLGRSEEIFWESARRLRASGDLGIKARSYQLVFEMPRHERR